LTHQVAPFGPWRRSRRFAVLDVALTYACGVKSAAALPETKNHRVLGHTDVKASDCWVLLGIKIDHLQHLTDVLNACNFVSFRTTD
jgi:hypothetical protein